MKQFSQLGQDVFVANYFDFKRQGTYLEVGCGYASDINNTFQLEVELGWKGISIDSNPNSLKGWYASRSNKITITDAFALDYKGLVEGSPYSGEIDYLSLDLDESVRPCLDCLKMIPCQNIKVITIEHDFYDNRDEGNRQNQRDHLKSNGFELVFADVCLEKHGSVEDWWIRKDIYEQKPIEKLSGVEYGKALDRWKFI